eukprot:2567012-Pleurochrysis_carterae.AAC.3
MPLRQRSKGSLKLCFELRGRPRARTRVRRLSTEERASLSAEPSAAALLRALRLDGDSTQVRRRDWELA